MSKGPFQANDFVATRFSTAADKAAFGNALLAFVEGGCKLTAFSQPLYARLSQCFRHIAHCDRMGFYEEWFASEKKKLRFIQHVPSAPCWGSAEYTFSDLECCVQEEMRRRNYIASLELRAKLEARAADLRLLEHLEAKYRHSTTPSSEGRTDGPQPPPTQSGDAAISSSPVQGNLFA